MKTPSSVITKKKRSAGYVYGIREIGSDQFFYVGSTIKTIEVRFQQHLSDVRRESHPNMAFALRVTRATPERCEVVLLQQVKRGLEKVEYRWIKNLYSQDHPLTNIVKSPRQGLAIGRQKRHSGTIRSIDFVAMIRKYTGYWWRGSERTRNLMQQEFQSYFGNDDKIAFTTRLFGPDACREARSLVGGVMMGTESRPHVLPIFEAFLR